MGNKNLIALEHDIARLHAAQRRMAAVNAALQRGDTQTLRQQQLSGEHIAELLKRHARGLPAYPDYVFRHNQEALEMLRRQAGRAMPGVAA